jgi:very-short-patch-repair endonuclease
VKNIRSDFHKWIPLMQEDKQYPLVGLRFLFVFLDGEEAHKGQQADRDFETDQFIKDQGSITLRFTYSGQLSETRVREIVDEIEAKHQEAQPP